MVLLSSVASQCFGDDGSMMLMMVDWVDRPSLQAAAKAAVGFMVLLS